MRLEEAAITFLVGIDSTTIEIHDKRACTTFCEIKLTPEQLSSALSRLSHTRCEVDVYSLDRVGKTHTNERFGFRIPKDLASSSHSDELTKLCIEALKESGKSGWVPDTYFGSQDSFIRNGDECYANAIIREWA